MARTSNSVDRVAALLNFLARHPGDSFSISELSRRVDISKATCHALIGSLLEAGFVQRNPSDRRIALGPALVSLGLVAASQPRQLVDHATDEMKFLASKYDAQCGATMVVGEEILVLDTRGTPGSFETSLHVGQRLPHRPPLGAIYVAWASAEERQEWLARQVDDGLDYDKVLDVIRDRGFSIALELDPRLRVEQVFQELRGDEPVESVVSALATVLRSMETEEYYVFDIQDDAQYNVRHIAAPVFGANRQIQFVLTLTSFGRPLQGRQIHAITKDVTACADRVTKSLLSLTRHSA